MPVHQLQFSSSEHYNFRATITSHGWAALAPFQWNKETGILAYRFALLSGENYHVGLQETDNQIQASITTSDSLSAEQLADVKQTLRWMLRLTDEDNRAMAEFYTLCEKESGLKHVPIEKGGRLLRSATVWEDALKVLTTTNTAWSGTIRMCQNLVSVWGDNQLFPSAETLAGIAIDDLKQKGGLGYRAAYVHELAQAVVSGTVKLEALKQTDMDAEKLYKFFRQLKGFGDYAATSMLMLLGKYGRVPVDSYAHKLVSENFFHGEKVTPAQIRATFDRFGQYAGLAYWCWNFEGDHALDSIK